MWRTDSLVVACMLSSHSTQAQLPQGMWDLSSPSENRSVVSDSLRPHGLYSPWNSPGQNTRVCSLSLLQGIFSTQGSNPCLPHCGLILYQLSHRGSPRMLEWVTYCFSRGSSQSRNRTWASCIAGRFFYQLSSRNSLPAELPGIKPTLQGRFLTTGSYHQGSSLLPIFLIEEQSNQKNFLKFLLRPRIRVGKDKGKGVNDLT